MCVFLRNISDWFLESRVYTIQFYRETKLCRMLSKTCICTYVMIAINTPSSSNTGNRLMTTSISRFSFLRKPIPYVHSPIICFSRSSFTNEIGMQYNPLIELSRLFGEFYNSIISSSTRAFSDWFTIFDYTHSLPPEVHARGYWFSIDAEKNPSLNPLLCFKTGRLISFWNHDFSFLLSLADRILITTLSNIFLLQKLWKG